MCEGKVSMAELMVKSEIISYTLHTAKESLYNPKFVVVTQLFALCGDTTA